MRNLSIVLLVATLGTNVLSASVPSQVSEPESTESTVETFDAYSVQNLPQQMPLTIQLPREDQGVPFYPSEPVTHLRPPQYVRKPQPDFYQVPVPSEYLTAPTEGTWNPNDDPVYYYELPAYITKDNVPTNEYPKKYNKEVHTKGKPIVTVPKKEITLEPISEDQYLQKQKDLYKTIQKLNKKENQKVIEAEKVPNRLANARNTLKPLTDNVSHQTNQVQKPAKALKPTVRTSPKPTLLDSSDVATTYDSSPASSDSNQFTRGLSPEITDSLGLSSHSHGAHSGNGERVLFHMAGQDGPMSYKWGYDTGKGHNRQFRFEERDKEGIVKGQFGYYDKEGKFRMMNYKAHPTEGFHMEAAPESDVSE